MGNKRYSMDSYTLKWIAIISMVIDHTGAILFPQYDIFRIIGRVAFPIFCFLLVEGFYHTSNVKKYMARLGAFVLISEVPFDLMIKQIVPYDSIWQYQNVFFTLLIGLIVIQLLAYVSKVDLYNTWKHAIIELFIIIVGCTIAAVLHTDYSILGILYIVIFYLYRGRLLTIAAAIAVVTVAAYGGVSSQILCIVAIPIIGMYNGEKGKSMKYLFYAFYPVHILVLCGISYFLHN